ncbi:hypothetical protein MTO96_033936 [Rhipicephalus appendiculatus]
MASLVPSAPEHSEPGAVNERRLLQSCRSNAVERAVLPRVKPAQHTRTRVYYAQRRPPPFFARETSPAAASFLVRSSVFSSQKSARVHSDAFTATLYNPSTASPRTPVSSRVAAAVSQIPVADASFLIFATGPGAPWPLLRHEPLFRICIIGASPTPTGLVLAPIRLPPGLASAALPSPSSFRTRESLGWPRRG